MESQFLNSVLGLVDDQPNCVNIFYEITGLAKVEIMEELVMTEDALLFCQEVVKKFNNHVHPHQLLRLANADSW